MNDERIDLSSLGLSQDPERMERMVGGVMWRARSDLARRSRALGPVEAVAAWFKPALAAAAAIAVISVGALTSVQRSDADPVQVGAYMSGTDVPPAATGWYEEGGSPTAAELLVAADEGGN